MSGGLKKLLIYGYTDKNFKKPLSGGPYSCMINPESIKWQRKIEYNEEQPPDSSAPSQMYKSTPSDELSFDIVIDCTGVVNQGRTNMAKEIGALEKIVYKYNGGIHRPNFVKIRWGKNIIFKSVLKSFDTTYTLFKPDGSPLRAKVSLSFGEYQSPKNVAKEDGDESPDVSHLVTVIEGETLPYLCDKIWDDQSYYIQVAKYNNLHKFRHLKGNKKLVFPPIIQPS